MSGRQLAQTPHLTMDLHDPTVAQQIVADYVRMVERQSENDEWPARADHLPYPKPTIKAAIQTAVVTLASTGQLTGEMREFLQATYVSLADYVPEDLARLMRGYQRAAGDLAAGPRLVQDKVRGDAWRTVAETGALAGEIARSIAAETELLREEFSRFAT